MLHEHRPDFGFEERQPFRIRRHFRSESERRREQSN
jgi:hypothetical protein